MANRQLIRRLLIHLIGAISIGLGVQTVVFSNIGSAPLDALTFYLSRIYLQLFQNSDFSSHKSILGIASLVVGTIATLILLIVKRDKRLIFTWLNIALVATIIFTWGFLFDRLTPLSNNILVKSLVAVLGVIILSFGVFLTLISGVPAGPHEELLLLYDRKINNLFVSKLIVEGTNLVLAFSAMTISSVVIDKGSLEFTQVGIFTIFTIFAVSILIHFFDVIYKKLFVKDNKEENNYES